MRSSPRAKSCSIGAMSLARRIIECRLCETVPRIRRWRMFALPHRSTRLRNCCAGVRTVDGMAGVLDQAVRTPSHGIRRATHTAQQVNNSMNRVSSCATWSLGEYQCEALTLLILSDVLLKPPPELCSGGGFSRVRFSFWQG